jgi:transposase InsO family protein
MVDLDGPQADGLPVLIAMSDNGPQMRSHSTKEFMAACAIMQRFGRPGTPTDQAWIESLFGHVKAEWPHLEKIRHPGELELELDRAGTSTTPSECMPGSATSLPTRNTTAAATPSGSPDRRPGRRPASPHRLPSNHEEPTMTRAPALAGY